MARVVTEWLLRGLECECCGEVTSRRALVCMRGGVLRVGAERAVLLTVYGNVSRSG